MQNSLKMTRCGKNRFDMNFTQKRKKKTLPFEQKTCQVKLTTVLI